MTRNASAYPRLLADVGGTNVRFALESAPMRIGEVTGYKVADFPSLEAAMRQYLQAQRADAVRHAAIGLANPVTGDHVKLTNHNWAFSIEQMRESLGLTTLVAINDFTSLALALPWLQQCSGACCRHSTQPRRRAQPLRRVEFPGPGGRSSSATW